MLNGMPTGISFFNVAKNFLNGNTTPESGNPYDVNRPQEEKTALDILDFLGIGTARRQNEYQQYLSNTAYQRALADMKAAGLSPAMMYASGGQGASTPSSPGGSVKTGQAMDILGNVGNIMNSITNARMVDDVTKNNEFKRSKAIGMYNAVDKILRSVK